ncbi:MAG: twin-arginine translocase TatA/TatE family subunit [Ilumatobacteraceae bacterium]|jgi:sec-independent protein translocase protein TatA
MPGGPELIIILVVVLVLFGGSQLPKLAKNLGKAQKEFKEGMGEGAQTPPPPADPAATQAAPPPPPPSPPPTSGQ